MTGQAKPDEPNLRQQMVHASPSHKPSMIQSFCEAFVDDPSLCWIWTDRDDRIARLPHFFEPIVSGTMANGIALCSDDGAAVSLWRQPGKIHPNRDEMIASLPSMEKAFSKGNERSQLLGETLKAHQPEDFDWWYLQFIGVRPAEQGTGLGGVAVRAGLELARKDGMPVYVEVMLPENVGYYRHVGFETIAEFDIPENGPHVWAMLWRG